MLERVTTTPDSAMWAALADPHRRALLGLLRERPQAVGELVDAVALSQPSTSKHLKVLREAGLVRVVPQAQRRVYEVDPRPLEALDAWLAPYRRMWSDSLDALGRRLDDTAPATDTDTDTDTDTGETP